MAFESLDAADGGEGERRWKAAGRPVLPSLAVGADTIPVLHVSQIAAALGLPEPPAGDPARLGWEAASLLSAWLGHLRGLGLDLLAKPTPSRGRSLRSLTVNVFHPFELLPDAWEAARFDWDPDGDDERAASLPDEQALRGFAEAASAGWSVFLLEHGDELERSDPLVASPRGEVRYSALVASQRWHAAYHYRQLVEFLRAEGVTLEGVFPLARLSDLSLPTDVY